LIEVDSMKLLEAEVFLVTKSCEVSVEWMRNLTQILGVQGHWEQVLLGVLPVERRQPRRLKSLRLPILYKFQQ
jgi:hypothetical protein